VFDYVQDWPPSSELNETTEPGTRGRFIIRDDSYDDQICNSYDEEEEEEKEEKKQPAPPSKFLPNMDSKSPVRPPT